MALGTLALPLGLGVGRKCPESKYFPSHAPCSGILALIAWQCLRTEHMSKVWLFSRATLFIESNRVVECQDNYFLPVFLKTGRNIIPSSQMYSNRGGQM